MEAAAFGLLLMTSDMHLRCRWLAREFSLFLPGFIWRGQKCPRYTRCSSSFLQVLTHAQVRFMLQGRSEAGLQAFVDMSAARLSHLRMLPRSNTLARMPITLLKRRRISLGTVRPCAISRNGAGVLMAPACVEEWTNDGGIVCCLHFVWTMLAVV